MSPLKVAMTAKATNDTRDTNIEVAINLTERVARFDRVPELKGCLCRRVKRLRSSRRKLVLNVAKLRWNTALMTRAWFIDPLTCTMRGHNMTCLNPKREHIYRLLGTPNASMAPIQRQP